MFKKVRYSKYLTRHPARATRAKKQRKWRQHTCKSVRIFKKGYQKAAKLFIIIYFMPFGKERWKNGIFE